MAFKSIHRHTFCFSCNMLINGVSALESFPLSSFGRLYAMVRFNLFLRPLQFLKIRSWICSFEPIRVFLSLSSGLLSPVRPEAGFLRSPPNANRPQHANINIFLLRERLSSPMGAEAVPPAHLDSAPCHPRAPCSGAEDL